MYDLYSVKVLFESTTLPDFSSGKIFEEVYSRYLIVDKDITAEKVIELYSLDK